MNVAAPILFTFYRSLHFSIVKDLAEITELIKYLTGTRYPFLILKNKRVVHVTME